MGYLWPSFLKLKLITLLLGFSRPQNIVWSHWGEEGWQIHAKWLGDILRHVVNRKKSVDIYFESGRTLQVSNQIRPIHEQFAELFISTSLK
ncbi:hypothetical protein CDAR_291671 [Caerostris darwini]|uniref:Uncharacterized protein n=1 Tax=Caerostris darwini TaxID=1538125 RepID=A0AAV4MU74_9ARAC|nr:hypothetical protein CDAR_291671 [Caerostris darwini]